ncbi:hypothetical protein TSAR_013947 [Trichomalopsis sarcophagae]|uniref:Uncharacterized protein n=1 Tax=Trichomalopsis sarcophagae TaxID=543379 RepID=A0A232FC26_9HYME|nr:hypothetical protein TSAR_013947 [Trichomalopsis sarcophagae]
MTIESRTIFCYRDTSTLCDTMFSRIWSLKIIYYYLTLLQQQTLGSPIWSQRETEILSTNWTEMADEWIKAKDRIAERISITLLPSNNKIHELPPTSSSFIFTNSVNVDQLTRFPGFGTKNCMGQDYINGSKINCEIIVG